VHDVKSVEAKEWPKSYSEKYPGSYWYHFKLTLERQMKITVRDQTFIKARLGQCVIVGAVAGSLFSNLKTTDISSMNGMLFFTVLFNALSSFALIPFIYDQRAVFYKQADALFLPPSTFAFAQVLVLVPLQIVEIFVFGTIMYWSAGLSADDNGARFLTFLVIVIASALCIGQCFRIIAYLMPSIDTASPVAGISIILMVLFSGFIQPKSEISYGWEWFYWINPSAWALRSVTVNQFLSSRYDYDSCVNVDCTEKRRYGDLILESYGLPLSQKWVWYGFAVLIGETLFLMVLSTIVLNYWRTEGTPVPPIRFAESEYAVRSKSSASKNAAPGIESSRVNESYGVDTIPAAVATAAGGDESASSVISFEPTTLAFSELWYTVSVAGQDLDILRGVSGYFEPGTLTALMGTTGAGKCVCLSLLCFCVHRCVGVLLCLHIFSRIYAISFIH
jgi:hypothetical protein